MADRNDYLASVNRAGAFQAVEWKSDVKPAAAHKARTLTKIVSATVRTGVQYANLAVNADVETGSLPWGEWAVYPYIIVHKGAEYARLYTVDGSVKTRYFIDGQEKSRDDFLALLTPAARKPSRPNGGTITVKLENVTLR